VRRISGMGELDGRVAVITGGAGAIGGALAWGLTREGACVALLDIRGERCRELCMEINRATGREAAVAHEVDVRNGVALREAFEGTVELFGRLDIMVNNAAVTQIKNIEDLTDDDIDTVIDVDLKGYIKCAREAVRILKTQGEGGVLLFISSKNGLYGAAQKSLYNAAKGGELNLARGLARELGPDGIRVNSLCPDAVLEGSALWEDPNYRLGTAERYGISEAEIPDYYRQRSALKVNVTPEDVAEAAIFLCSGRSSKITGAILSVDGGVAFVR
jgi:NAD(P)-dependent dehydrogenase (short-subunit alcohol dehydrogenase family)